MPTPIGSSDGASAMGAVGNAYSRISGRQVTVLAAFAQSNSISSSRSMEQSQIMRVCLLSRCAFSVDMSSRQYVLRSDFVVKGCPLEMYIAVIINCWTFQKCAAALFGD